MKISPVKICFSFIIGSIGIAGMLLGIHGIYVYFTPLNLLFIGESGDKLFLTVSVVPQAQNIVMWTSKTGYQSWVIPVLITIAGILVFNYSRLGNVLSRYLNKLRP